MTEHYYTVKKDKDSNTQAKYERCSTKSYFQMSEKFILLVADWNT